MSMYIVKRSVTKVIHTINVDSKPTILGFSNAKQAKTYARLMMDMSQLTSLSKRRFIFDVECVNMNEFIKKCSSTSLDVVYYSDSNNYMIYNYCDYATSDIIECLESFYNNEY